ncbi:LysR family transcriptional regulator, partial [Gemmata sp. JC673]|nr:LysR family transcriptional regulator [Gemmata algarum]
MRQTLSYLKNNEKRMNYVEYRKKGRGVSSSMVESLIKDVNYRVKGTEKFWNDHEGAEAIL